MPIVSVIIPCYNLGAYVEEAVDSVMRQSFEDYEIIVVNDGSTDTATTTTLNNLVRAKTKVVHTENMGLCSARNKGIELSTGKYTLPLDADDRIGETYLEKAVSVLDRNEEIGIVYCRAEYFGTRTGEMPLMECTPENMVNCNTIFCSAVFRRRLWDSVGGYNVNMKFDLEDWDLWLSFLERGVKVHKLDEILFYYRKRGESRNLLITKDIDKLSRMHAQLFLNHKEYFEKNLVSIFERYYKTIDKYSKYKQKSKRRKDIMTKIKSLFKRR